MSTPRWQEIADALRAYAGPASQDQVALAAHAGLTVNKRLPQPVTAALLRRTLRSVLHLPNPRSASKGQLDYVRNLAAEVGRRILTPLDDQEIVDAWVKAFHALRAARSLQRLRPCVGDIVEVDEVFGRVPAEIASISADGRLNFKGGAGSADAHTRPSCGSGRRRRARPTRRRAIRQRRPLRCGGNPAAGSARRTFESCCAGMCPTAPR